MLQNKKLSTNKLTIFKNFTFLDLAIFFLIIGISFVLGFTTNKFNIWLRLLITIFVFLSTFWVLFKSTKHNCRYYFLVFRIIKFKIQVKKYKNDLKNADTSFLIPYEKLEDEDIVKVSSSLISNYISAFKIRGYDLFTDDFEDQEAYFNQLTQIFNNIDFKITFIKKTEPMVLDKNIKLIEDNILSSTEIEKNETIRNYYSNNLIDFTELNNARNTDYYYLVIYANDKKILKDRQQDILNMFYNTKLKVSIIKNIELLNLLTISSSKVIKEQDYINFLERNERSSLFKKSNAENKSIKKISSFKKFINNLKLLLFKKQNETNDNDKNNNLVDLLKPKEVEFKKSYVKVDDYYLSYQSFNEFNSLVINNGWMKLMSESSSTFIVNLEPLNENQKQKLLDKTSLIIEANSSSDKSKFRQSKKNATLEVINDLIEQINIQHMNIFNMNITLINRANDLNSLRELEKINKQNFNQTTANINPNFYLQKEAYANTNFIQKDYLKNNLEITSKNISAGWMWVNNDLNDKNDFLLGFNLNSGSPVIFDIFKKTKDRTSFSMALLGLSGVGKSALTEKFIWNQIMNNNEVIVFDPQREYGDLAKKLNGNIIELGRGDKTKINPLQLDNMFVEDIEKDFKNLTIINQNIKKVKEFFTLLYPDLEDRHLRVLTILLTAFYKKQGYYDPKLNINNLKNTDFATMSDFYEFINTFKFANALEENLLRQYLNEIKLLILYDFMNNGLYQHLYNGHTNIDFKNDLTILDTYNLDVKNQNSSTQGALYLILSFVQNRITNNFFYNKDKNKKIVLVVDEAHKFIDPQNMSSLRFLFDTVKTIRKYNGSLILTTQNLSDFRQNLNVSGLSQALFDNLAYTGIFKLNQKDIDLVDEMYRSRGGLTKAEKMFLSTAGIGELIFNVDNSTRFILETYYNRFEKSQIFKKGDGKKWGDE
ncbi:zonular occludens toxin domain-containing protein [Mycoplasmopsis cynos]|uniref:Mbov_0397 family ICE element conjugal transfer ATPase n=1 Tax=Mycoplasmopsis cynos TaxID=171284 RepID=UPI002AFFFEE6|nr:zonular occludens toxin domain-containing protein [Mycoplasmopsis cynos]WQQ16118.1 zonular occludens toxin domain-containing protein [Mycoplasmopsis cynos]